MKKRLSIFVLLLLLAPILSCPKRPKPAEVVPVMPEREEEAAEKEKVEELKPKLELKRIHFELDRYNLRPDAIEDLKENAKVLKAYPEVRVLIEGHCCELGTAEYNLALGERRARAAYDYLIRLGIEPKRLSTISYGEHRPLDPYNLPLNRRCEFIIKQ